MNVELISINGLLIPMTEYTLFGRSIIFREQPAVGDMVSIIINEDKIEHVASGVTTIFSLPPETESDFKRLTEDLYKHKNNPTVKDYLDKLRVVVELLR